MPASRSATIVLALIGALTVALGLTACQGDTRTTADGGAPHVVASTDVWAQIASVIGGDHIRVGTIIPNPATDPHDYQPSPADAASVAKADLVVVNGGGYDKFATDIVKSVGAEKRTIDAFDVPITGDGLGGVRKQSDTNEHVWYDVSTVDAVANAIAAKLSKLDPQHAGDYSDSAHRLHSRFVAITQKADGIKRAKGGTAVASTEPVAAYLLKQANLVDLAPQDFTEAIEQGTDPSPASVAAMDALLTQHKAAALVYNTQTESPTTAAIRHTAEQAHVPVVPVTETLPAGMTYVQWITGELDALGRALGVS